MQANGGIRLVVRRGPQPNQTYELSKDIIALGRDITNDIVINDPEVSRHHCRLTRTPTGYTLEDLGSTNGTFVNGQRLTGVRPLLNGDTIGLGETVTLSYEARITQAPGVAQQETMIGATARPPAYGPQPVVQPEPYAPPARPPQYEPYVQPQYSAPAQPYAEEQAGYEYYEEQPQASNTGRWIAIGCGCLVLLCIASIAIIGFVIDYLNLWCDLPLIPDLFNLQCPQNIGLLLPLLLPVL